MINSNVKKRLEALILTGAQVVEFMEQLVKVAKNTNASDAAMLCGYADDTLQPGEFTAEIHFIVKRVLEKPND